MLRRTMLLGALASGFLLAAGASAQAAYTFNTTNVVNTSASAPGTTVVFTPTPVQPGTVPLDFPTGQSLVTATYTLPATSQSGTASLSFTETLTSLTTGQTAVFNVVGSYNFTQNPVGVVIAPPLSAANFTITPVSGSGFGLSFQGYSATSTTTADISFNIVPPTAVPEPASLALMGSGLVGVLGLGLRRRMKQA